MNASNSNERQSEPTASPSATNSELNAAEPLGSTACSALLDLFAGWAIMQVLKNRSDVTFRGAESGEMSDRMVVMSMPGMASMSASPEGFIRHLLEQHSPTLELELTQLKVDAPLRSPWNRPHPCNEKRYREPLVRRFLESVGSAMRLHSGASEAPQSGESPDPE